MSFHDDTHTDEDAKHLGGRMRRCQPLARGTGLGRYIILEPIGEGGMGEVYRAYDPELDRSVALKILSIEQTYDQTFEKAKSRLVREAQALAQLSHPNVVAVHDVGSVEEDVFIAMEWVEGQTLREWLVESKRSISEVLSVLQAAGKGLAAAHQAGLVHRDFKPDNVIVGLDGRVRVLDFGLACAASEASDQDQNLIEQRLRELKEISSSSPSLLPSPLTRAGGILGTPMYMAPEQHLGRVADQRTDQFGFCLVLYEALYGVRPFAAKKMKDMVCNVIQHRLSDPPPDSGVPSWLRAIVVRGLSSKPEDRYPSMEALLAELLDPEEVVRKQRAQRRRLVFVLLVVLLGIGLPLVVWYGLKYKRVSNCMEVQTELVGIWDRPTQETMEQAFLSTKKPYSAGTWQRVQQIFEQYIHDWSLMRAQICEATWLSGTQSEELLDRKMDCLTQRLDEVRELGKVFLEADASVVEKAVVATSGLSSLQHCQDKERLYSRMELPAPDAKRLVENLRQKLVEVRMLNKAGKYRKAHDKASQILKQAASLGYQPLSVEAMYWAGALKHSLGRSPKAVELLREAFWKAVDAKHLRYMVRIGNQLAWVITDGLSQYQKGLQWGETSKIGLRLLDKPTELMAQWHSTMGMVLFTNNDAEKSIKHYRKALGLYKELLGSENLMVGKLFNNIGYLFWGLGDFAQAQRYYRRALAVYHSSLGENHPMLAISHNNLGHIHWKEGRFDQALVHFRRAGEIYKASLSPDHPRRASALNNMGYMFCKKKEYPKALEYLTQALEIWEKTLGKSHRRVSWPLAGLGECYLALGQPEKAQKYLMRVQEICAKSNCDAWPKGISYFLLAELAWKKRNHSQARTFANQALQTYQLNSNLHQRDIAEVQQRLLVFGTHN